MIAIARSQTTQIARHPRALTLSATLHVLVALAWLIAPTPKRDLGAGAMTVQLLVEAPPQPEPPAPEPPKAEPPKPEPAKPQPPPEPKPVAAKPAPSPKPAPRTPAAPPVPAAATTAASEAAQPVMNGEPTPANIESAPAAPAVAVGTPNARAVERDDYLRMVWSRIMRYRPEKVPFAGTTRLRFTLTADGALVDVGVALSSGSGLLDRAALDAVRRAAPFPSPPLSADGLTFEIPFQFR